MLLIQHVSTCTKKFVQHIFHDIKKIRLFPWKPNQNEKKKIPYKSEDHLTTSFTQCCSIHVHIFHKCVLCLVDVQNQFHVGSLGNPTETRKHVFLTNQRTILQSHFTQSCTVQVSYFP
jgi:hypothetical protein